MNNLNQQQLYKGMVENSAGKECSSRDQVSTARVLVQARGRKETVTNSEILCFFSTSHQGDVKDSCAGLSSKQDMEMSPSQITTLLL